MLLWGPLRPLGPTTHTRTHSWHYSFYLVPSGNIIIHLFRAPLFKLLFKKLHFKIRLHSGPLYVFFCTSLVLVRFLLHSVLFSALVFA